MRIADFAAGMGDEQKQRRPQPLAAVVVQVFNKSAETRTIRRQRLLQKRCSTCSRSSLSRACGNPAILTAGRPFAITGVTIVASSLVNRISACLLNLQRPLTIGPFESATLAARLLFETNPFNAHPTIDRLAHIVDGQRGDADGGQGFHLYASPAEHFNRCFDL